MRPNFEEAKSIVLAAAYETLYRHSDYESYPADLIHKQVAGLFSLGYARRALASLHDDSLIRIDGVDDGPNYYSLTEQGLAAAESMPSLQMLLARFYVAAAEDDEQQVPASDRIVRLNHNQIAEAEAPITEIIEALEVDNGNPDQPGLRERLIGQFSAARELVRAGEYRAYLMYELLVRALGEVIKRYGNPSIVALANALLGAVVSQLLQA